MTEPLQGCCSFLDDRSDAELIERADTGIQLFDLLRKLPKDTLSKYKQNALPVVLDYLWDTQLHARATLDKRRAVQQLNESRQSFSTIEATQKRIPRDPDHISKREQSINLISEFESLVASIQARLNEVATRLQTVSAKQIDAYLTTFDFAPNDPLRPTVGKSAKSYQQKRQLKAIEFKEFAARWWNEQRETNPGSPVSDRSLIQFGELCESCEYKPNSTYLTNHDVYDPIAKYNASHREAVIKTFPQLISVFLKSKASTVAGSKMKKKQNPDYLDWRPFRAWIGTMASRARKA